MKTSPVTIEQDRKLANLPKSWVQAIGLLKGKNMDPLKYQRTIRQEWEDRFQKLIKQSRGR